MNRLSDQLRKSKAAGYHPTRGRSSVKSSADCTKRHQRNLKRKRSESCSDSLSWLEGDGYTATHVVVQNTTSGAVETIVLDHAEVEDPQSVLNDEDLLNMVLYIKDRYNMSGMFVQN